MKKNIGSIFVCLFAWISLITNVYANPRPQEFLQDKDEILSQGVADSVEKTLGQMEKDYDFGVYVYLDKSSLDNQTDPGKRAESLLEKTDKADCALLYINVQTRDWVYTAQGTGEIIFCDECRRWIMKDVLDELAKDNYDKAVTIFVDESKMFLQQAQTNEPYSAENLPPRPVPFVWVCADIVFGLVVGFVVAHHKKSALTSIGFTDSAQEYLVEGSFQLLAQKDTFVDKKTSTRIIEKSSTTKSSDSTTSQGKF